MTRSVAVVNVVLVSVAMGMLTGCGAASRLPVGMGAPVVRSQAILDPGYYPPTNPGCWPTPKPNPFYPKPNPRTGTRAILPPNVNPGSGCR